MARGPRLLPRERHLRRNGLKEPSQQILEYMVARCKAIFDDMNSDGENERTLTITKDSVRALFGEACEKLGLNVCYTDFGIYCKTECNIDAEGYLREELKIPDPNKPVGVSRVRDPRTKYRELMKDIR